MPTSLPTPARRVLAATTAVVALALAGCTAPADEPAPTAPLLAEAGLDGLDAAEIIERLDTTALADRPTDLVASVRPDAVVLGDDQEREATVPMPADAFYVSVAPYVEQTHDCYFHSLTTCVGELQGEEVAVTVTDDATGEVLVDREQRTYDNGFVGLWLPRDVDATLTVEHDGRTATREISTGVDDPTCLTDVRLT